MASIAAAPSAKNKHSIFSDYTLRWVWPLVKQGYFSVLLEDSVPEVPTELSAEVVLRQIEAYWEADKVKAAAGQRRPSLEYAFWRVCRREVYIGSAFGVLAGICNTVAKPLLLRSLIQGIGDGTPTKDLWVLFGGILLVLMVEAFAFVGNRHAITDRWFLIFSSCFSGLAQTHSMRVATSQVVNAPDLGNLVSSDLSRIHGYLMSLSFAPVAFTSLVAGVIILLYTIGVAGLVGIVPMFLMLVINAGFSQAAKRAEKVNLERTDKRMGIMTQIIHGIRAIKFCAWEASFSDLVTEARKRECIPLKRFRVLNQGTVQLGRANPYIGAVFAFIYLAIVSRDDPDAFHPKDIFPALNIFLSLRVPMIILPESILYFTTMRVSIRRLQQVLDVPEAACAWPGDGAFAAETKASILIRSASFKWPTIEDKASEDSPNSEANEIRKSLRDGQPMNIDKLDVPAGSFCAVVGSVASGKSSLFSAILGEMPQINRDGQSTVQICANGLAVVPQKAFILSGTVRDNILMGDTSPDEARLQLALQRSELHHDIALLPNGQLTEVGERGVVLSGGQQQRLSIARAFYAHSDLLLADDPLSALDPTVASEVFHGFWSYVREAQGTRTCVVVLNQLWLLPHFDQVIVVSNGQVVESGSPSQVLGQQGVLTNLCTSAGCLSAMASTPLCLKPVSDTWEESAKRKISTHDKLVLNEQKLAGAMSNSVFMRYIKGMGFCWFSFCILTTATCYGSMAFMDFWLAHWVDTREKKWNDGKDANDDFYVGVYGGAAGVFLALLWITSYCFSDGGVRSSKDLHKECLDTIFRAPVSFFEATPSGRITSRFSNDLSSVDSAIPRWMDNNIQFVATIITLGIQIACVVPSMTPILLVCYLCYGWQVRSVNRTNREVRRYANSAMSPMLTTLNESGNGRLVIRTMGKAAVFRSRFCKQVDDVNRFTYASTCVVSWGQSFVYAASLLISGATAAIIIANRESYEPSMAALSLTYTFILPYFLNVFCLIFQFFLGSLSSLERLLQYGKGGIVPEEAAWHMPTEPAHDELWPSQGEIRFESVSLVYRPGLPKSVDCLTFALSHAEKIGIVGRSGAGKSSIMVLLFRLHEATEGRILIDGVDIATVGLRRLRRAIAIVPQEPLLISGTVRINLDPFGEHTDSALVNVLEEVQLDPGMLSNNTLASTLSFGERQLLTVGRTLLWPARLRVFDEPTSNIDAATDNVIQSLLRSSESLKSSTQITIAHRLQTVLCCNRILVMAAGRLIEAGPPSKLLADPNSELSNLAQHAGVQLDETEMNLATISSI